MLGGVPPRRLPALAALAALVALALPAGASASSWATTSSNWAGYAVSQPGVSFRRVTGTWVAPTAHCGSGDRRYSAAWLGLGGLHTSARALEQVGTEADCAGGKGYYSAWYELVPAAPVKLGLTVRPGDTMSAAVTVSGHSVKLFIADRTRGTSFSKRLGVAPVDVSSAEWIVEAPSACGANGPCRALPLANFGATSFAGVAATSATGHVGTISDPGWSSVAITLSTRGRGLRFTTDQAAGTALPANLSPAGDAFGVTYQAAADAAPAT
jgi:peptidase A4-like protein